MRHLSAQYLITGTGDILRRPVITLRDDGTIVSITDTGGDLSESAAMAFYNGVLTPGFINCHCHLELSHFRGMIKPSTGLPAFIKSIRHLREHPPPNPRGEALRCDRMMAAEGIVACADICNTTDSFYAKELSSIAYTSFIELFGINPAGAAKRLAEAAPVAEEARRLNLRHYLSPHSPYAASLPLLNLIMQQAEPGGITSIHFMESPDEVRLINEREGAMLDIYHEFGVDASSITLPPTYADAIYNHITGYGNLLLVHNTFTDRDTAEAVNSRGNTYWCLCPLSNRYISDTMPPATMLRDSGCTIVLGTDSLASNSSLSILDEMKALQHTFPMLTLNEMIIWATANGAKALCEESWCGTAEPGKRPGLLLIEDIDLLNLKLTPTARVKRVI